ncbi:zinc transporter 11-like [Bidens hawaiensis]|uniref:zinc transporter 11-like n=1 Tax=Bidens hawaiensis TaxID=980011 RepID=UPI00404A0012
MFCYLLFISLVLLLVISTSAHGGGGDHDDDDDDNTTTNQKPNLRAKSLILVKICCFVIIFIGTFVGGVSPYFFKWNEEFLVLGTQFAGGVFLGTAMMHFLSDSHETFKELTSVEYPFAFMLACAGYLLTMFADSVISYVYGKQGNFDIENQGRNRHGRDETSNSKTAISSVSSLVDSMLLIVALCFHSVFEGIDIGIADSESDAWKALWTIFIHKIFAAVAMVIALLRMIPGRAFLSCAAYVFAFGISSPIGVGIGIIVDDTKEGCVADWIFAISMGIACGVFVYVSINHLLRGYQARKPAAVDTPHHKLLAVMLGIGVIAVVMFWD